jgi:hypothetical protein
MKKTSSVSAELLFMYSGDERTHPSIISNNADYNLDLLTVSLPTY